MTDINIGAWRNETKEGVPYLNGSLPDGRKWKLFFNGAKQPGDKQPEYNLKISDPKVQNVSFVPEGKTVDEEIPF
jgi:hypothetical protein